ncbi:hypothetical protein AAVH_12963 [Aphelenchoides avenae]|nr:hypothetical protein AAVH_33053 [Aphelenchus avenae]KAH7719608.1 hypothetical protein AAVH_12963 [Aphelenchus avenae]
MQDVLFFGSFFFCSRDDLEHLQALSQSLHNMIVNFSEVLPLRPIDYVSMDSGDYGTIQIIVEDHEDIYECEPDYVASIDYGDFAETFRRLQHTCIKDFCVGIRDSAFLRYWMAQETVAFAVVDIEMGRPGTADYDVLYSIVSHLRPRTMTAEAQYGEPFPPPAFFLAETGYSNYKLTYTNHNVSDGIDDFIESFVRDGCANKKLDSVCVEWDTQPMPRMPKQLSNPTEINLPVPYDEVAAGLIPADRHECEMYSFVNTKQRKRMEVYNWTLDYGPHEVPTYIFKCYMKDLFLY